MARARKVHDQTCPTCGKGDSITSKDGGSTFYCHRCSAEFKKGAPVEVADASLSEATVRSYHETLLQSDEPLAYLLHTRGIPLRVVRKHRLGLERGHLYIPIPTEGGFAFAKHGLPKKGSPLIFPPGARAQLYPWGFWPEKPTRIVLTAGEWDTLVARGFGLHAFCSTAGEATWYPDWSKALLPYVGELVVLYDEDPTGRSGAIKVAHSFLEAGAPREKIKIVRWGAEAKDLSDWVLLGGHGKEDLLAKIKATPAWYPPLAKAQTRDRTIVDTDLNQAGWARNAGRYCRFNALVVAAASDPWQIPKTVALECGKDQGKTCLACKLPAYKTQPVEIPLDLEDPDLLRHLGADRKQVVAQILKDIGVPKECRSIEVTDREAVNVYGARLTDTFRVDAEKDPEERTALSIGAPIRANEEYQFVARTLSHPKTQELTHVVHELHPSKDDLAHHKSDGRVLRKLRRKPKERIDRWLDRMLGDAEKITGIIGRRDLHLAVLLTYHTPLWMRLDAQTLVKGWGDICLIGDSGQGKSSVTKALVAWTRLGDRCAVKRSSEAGLLGGCREYKGQSWIEWGVFPRADRRLLILEEVKGAKERVLAALTDARSEGVAEVALLKGGRRKTNSRTRVIWISNPRSDRSVSQYDFPCYAVVELMGALEDVRRFDLALILSSAEMDSSQYGKSLKGQPEFLTQEALSGSILRVWSQMETKIAKAPQRRAIKCSEEAAKVYHASIPLVEPADDRFKLLRLATGLANWMQEPVGEEHVEWVARWRDQVYSSPTHGYRAYSEDVQDHLEVKRPEEIAAVLHQARDFRAAARLLLRRDQLVSQDFQDAMGGDLVLGAALQSALVLNGALERRGRGAYVKSEAGVEVLKKWSAAPPERPAFRPEG